MRDDRARNRAPTIFRLVTLFAVGYTATALAVGALWRATQPPRLMGVLSAKLEYLRANADRYDALFLGSSLTYRSVDPVRFDQAMTRLGCRVSSFNLGVPSLDSVEAAWLAQQLSSRGSWRQVLIEILPETHVQFGNLANPRTRYFSTLSALPLRLREIGASPRSGATRLRDGAAALVAVAYDLSGVGRLAAWLPTAPPASDELGALNFSRAGYVPLDLETDAAFAARAEYHALHHDGFARRLEVLRSLPRASASVSGRRWRTIARAIDQARALSDRVVVVIPPHPSVALVREAWSLQAAWTQHFPTVPLVDLNDPVELPRLLSADLWFDNAHVNDAGAAVVTEGLAEALCNDARSQ